MLCSWWPKIRKPLLRSQPLYLTCWRDIQQTMHLRPTPTPFDIHTMGFGLGLWACPLLSLLKTKGMLFWYGWLYFKQIWKAAKCYEIACLWSIIQKKNPNMLVGCPVLWECDSRRGKKVMRVNAHNKETDGILNTRSTAIVSSALVLTLCLWAKYFQIYNLDLLGLV